MVKKSKGYRIRLDSPCRRCWSPFLGPSARKCNGGLGANPPVLSHTLPVYLLQISPGVHLELGWPWPKLKESRHWPSSQTEQLGTLGFETASSQTEDPESSAPIHNWWATINNHKGIVHALNMIEEIWRYTTGFVFWHLGVQIEHINWIHWRPSGIMSQ